MDKNIQKCNFAEPDLNSKEYNAESHVVFKIEGTEVLCSKDELSKHSNYFETMFRGTINQSHNNVIILKVSLEPFNLILKLIRDPLLYMNNDDDQLLPVLKGCILYEFNDIYERLISRLRIPHGLINNCQQKQTNQQTELQPKRMKFQKIIPMHSQILKADIDFNENIAHSDVILELENEIVVCNKEDLSGHSDYFKALFDGNFNERQNKIIKLKDVQFKSFNVILNMIKKYHSCDKYSEELLLSALEVCILLQFNGIKERIMPSLVKSLTRMGYLRLLEEITQELGVQPFTFNSNKKRLLLYFEKVVVMNHLIKKSYTPVMDLNQNSSDANVILKIQDIEVFCNKEQLSEHSDYFRAMFDGYFIERHKKVIQLKDVSLMAFYVILNLISNPLLCIKNEQLRLLVLEVCVMLQFNRIKEQLALSLEDLLCINNCIKIWKITEQLGLKSFTLEPKRLGLLHFETLKGTNNILLLDLEQLYYFLADIKLNCKREIHVYEQCMDWWLEHANKKSISSVFRMQIFLCFLCCLDFGSLSCDEIYGIMRNPYFSEENEIVEILKYVLQLKLDAPSNIDDWKLYNLAAKLYNCEPRNPKVICIFLNAYWGSTKTNDEYNIAYFDESKREFVTFASVFDLNLSKLCGFKGIGNLDTIYILGGEFGIGTGKWNHELWTYSCSTKIWKKKKLMPDVRRHFLAVIGGDYLYVVGGTGNYRKRQQNMFYYNMLTDCWSELIELPCADIIKSGYCNDQLVLVDSSLACLYLFDDKKKTWSTQNIRFQDVLPTPLTGSYAILMFNNIIIFKGKYFIRMVLLNGTHKILDVGRHNHSIIDSDRVLFACNSGSIIYSFLTDEDTVILEKYCTKTNVREILFHIREIVGQTPNFSEFVANAFDLPGICSEYKGVINKFDF